MENVQESNKSLEQIIDRLKEIAQIERALKEEAKNLSNEMYAFCPFEEGEKVYIDLYDGWMGNTELKETTVGYIVRVICSRSGFTYAFNKAKKDGTISSVAYYGYGGNAVPRKYTDAITQH